MKKFWTQAGAPAGAVKALLETRFFKWVRRSAPVRVKTAYIGATKLFETTTVFECERERLVEKAPLRLLRTFGVTGQLSALMWQVECEVRDRDAPRQRTREREDLSKGTVQSIGERLL